MTNYLPVPLPGTTNPPQGQIPTVLRKIRAGMARSEALNPITTPPWLPPASINAGPGNATRANSTTYAVGSVFMNAAGTHQFYVRASTGNTAGSEPALVTNPIVTTVPYNLYDITDGSATLRWLGPVRTTAAQPGAPTVSQGALPSSLTVTNTFGPSVDGAIPFSKFLFSGGSGAFSGVGSNFQVFIRGSSTTVGNRSPFFSGNYYWGGNGSLARDAYVEFMTDAPYLAFDLANQSGAGNTGGYPFEFIIDNRRLCDAPICGIANVTAGQGNIILDFRSSGGRRPRKFKIGCPNNSTFVQFFTSPADTVWIDPDPNRWTLACVGDSIMIGTGNGPELGGYGMAQVFGSLVGASSTANLSVTGTGLIANNSGSELTYLQRVNDVIGLTPDVVWVFGSFNDNAQSAAAIQAAAVAYLQALRAGLPNAIIIFSGSWGYSSVADAAIQAAVTQFNDLWTFFVPTNSATPPMRSGSGTITATTGSGNSDIYVCSDVTHPLQNGHYYSGHWLAAAFKTLISAIAG